MKYFHALAASAAALAIGTSADAATVTIRSAQSSISTCSITVEGTAVTSDRIPATAVSLYLISPAGESTPLVINQQLGTDGSYAWTGPVNVTAPSLSGYTIKAFTNRQVNVSAPLQGPCTQ